MKGMISVSPNSYIFPYIQTRKIPYLEISVFSLIFTYLWTFRLPALVTKLYNMAPHPLLLGTVLRGLFKMLSPRLDILKIPAE